MENKPIDMYPGLSSNSEGKILQLYIGGVWNSLVVIGVLITASIALILLPKETTFLQHLIVCIFIVAFFEGIVIYWKRRIKAGKTKSSKKIFDADKKNWETAQKLKQLVTVALESKQWGRFSVFESMKIYKSMYNVELSIPKVSYLNKFNCLFVGELAGHEIVVMSGVTEEFKHGIVSDVFHYRIFKNLGTHVGKVLKDIEGTVLESFNTKWPDYSEDSVDIECLELDVDVKVITSINGTEVFPAWKILEICEILKETLD